MATQKVILKNQIKIDKPKMYAVVIYNDELTTMEFVIQMLMEVFNKSLAEATELMFKIHEVGKGIAGVYTYDIAITKKCKADMLAIESNFPLKIMVEEYTKCI